MTATHVGSLSAKPAAPKPAAAANAPEAAGAPPFRQHLQDARGHGRPAAHDAHPQRGPDPARDRRHDPSPQGPDSRQSPPASARLDKSGDGAATPAAQTADTATTPTPPTAAPQPSAVLDVATPEPASPDKDGDDEDAATALVESMLALIGPALGKLTTPAGAAAESAAEAATAKLAAAQAGPITLTLTGAAAAPAIDPAALALATATPAAELLKLDPDATREAVRLDAAPGAAPTAAHAIAAPAPTSAPVPVAPAHAFAQELGQQVAWSVGHDIKQARIRLHPEELGSLDLKISVQNNRVDVVFHAQHPGAVTAVQQSLPQLDQMLAQHGLSLGHAEVGQRDRGDQRGQAGQGEGADGTAEVQPVSHVTPLSQIGLVDAFA